MVVVLVVVVSVVVVLVTEVVVEVVVVSVVVVEVLVVLEYYRCTMKIIRPVIHIGSGVHRNVTCFSTTTQSRCSGRVRSRRRCRCCG